MRTTEENIEARIRDQYPHAASLPVSMAPRDPEVDQDFGAHGSYVKFGRRFFCFASTASRDRFARTHKAKKEAKYEH